MKIELIGVTKTPASAINPVITAASNLELVPSASAATDLAQAAGRYARLLFGGLLFNLGPGTTQGVRFTLEDGRVMEVKVSDPRDPSTVTRIR